MAAVLTMPLEKQRVSVAHEFYNIPENIHTPHPPPNSHRGLFGSSLQLHSYFPLQILAFDTLQLGISNNPL